MSQIPDELWRWVRGDLSSADFEKWLYASREAEAPIGEALYLELISMDFRGAAVAERRERLIRELPRACLCPVLRDRQRVPMMGDTSGFMASCFESVRSHSPFLDLLRCQACGQPWYVGTDERDDDWYFQRLARADAEAIENADRWPTTFDDFDAFWLEDRPRLRPPADFNSLWWWDETEVLPRTVP